MVTKIDHGATTERQKALSTALDQIHKQYGAGSAFFLGQDGPIHDVATVPTGSLPVDIATGIGGFPRGRIVEIFGPESSGKTTLALTAIASAQATGGAAAFIDAEHALDPQWAETLGVDTDDLLTSQPDTGEQALEITERLVRSGALDIVVIDSVAALTPKAEIEGEMGDSHVGLHARLMSQALRKLTSVVKSSKTTVIFINQIRHKIGVMFGSPETTTGGNALKFYASMRIDVRRREAIKNGDDQIGNEVAVKIAKNKMAPPFRSCKTKLFYDRGFYRGDELVTLGVYAGEITKSGSWYAYGDTRIGQGWQQAAKWMDENPEAADKIEAAIRDAALPKARATNAA